MSRTALTDQERLDWLRLARTESIGAVTFDQLMRRYSSAGAVLDALPDLAQRGGRSAPLDIPSPDEARRELVAGAALGARL